MAKRVMLTLTDCDRGSSWYPWADYTFAVSENVAKHLQALATRQDGGMSEGLGKIEKVKGRWYASWCVDRADSEPFAHCPGGVYDDLKAAMGEAELTVYVSEGRGKP